MALDFPSNPSDGQIYDNYYWDADAGVWNSLGNYDIPNILSNGVFTASSGTTVPLTAVGASGQSANLQEWKSSAGSTLASINASGGLSLGTALSVQNGGTGATSLTSGAYLKGTGSSAITAQTGIPAADLTGTIDSARLPTVPVSIGGTGATTGSGLVTIIPTSATMSSGTVTRDTTTGRVTFSGTGGIILNGVFSNTYTNYVVKIEMTGTSQPNDYVYWRFTQNGSYTTVAAYYGGAAYNQGTTLATFQSNQGTAYVSMGYAAATGGNTYSINVFAPYNTAGGNRPTVTFHSCYENTSVWGSSKWNGGATFDGFWFYPAGAGTITGNVTVYGQR
jgi:hypothetical protein